MSIRDEQPIRVLLVDDDEDDYVVIRNLLNETGLSKYALTWAGTYDAALEELGGRPYDICVIDYRLGDRDGLALLEESRQRGLNIPAILLTGRGDRDIDLRAMKAGIADYLEKDQLTPSLLERSIRYAIEHGRITRTLQHLSRRILSAQEKERQIIAKELHDRIGSSLTAIKFGIERKLDAMRNGTGVSEEIRLEDLIPLIQNTIKEVKRMQRDLRPPIIEDLGIRVALGSLCREFGEICSDIQIEPSLEFREEELEESLKIVIYRISQEALANIVKHSRADKARLSLTREENQWVFMIQDNGVGFDIEEILQSENKSRGLGIDSMRERTQDSGGFFTMDSGKSRGTTLRMTWPTASMP